MNWAVTIDNTGFVVAFILAVKMASDGDWFWFAINLATAAMWYRGVFAKAAWLGGG